MKAKLTGFCLPGVLGKGYDGRASPSGQLCSCRARAPPRFAQCAPVSWRHESNLARLPPAAHRRKAARTRSPIPRPATGQPAANPAVLGPGQLIAERQQQHGWGKGVVENMARDLQTEFAGMSGFSASNLWRMRTFLLEYQQDEFLAQLVREILQPTVGELN